MEEVVEGGGSETSVLLVNLGDDGGSAWDQLAIVLNL